MSPTLDWTCPHCGNRETWELVPGRAAAPDREAARPPVDPRTIDYTCSRCGTTDTWMLVPAQVASGR
jgi:DNA-directed RNA polymerase subunit RPC12/RpoP